MTGHDHQVLTAGCFRCELNRDEMTDSASATLTIAEAAEDAGCTERTIRRWIAEGRLTVSRRGDGRLVVDHADLNRVEAVTRRHGGRLRTWDKRRTMS